MEKVINDLVLFFSWQSDLPDETNRRLIREGIRKASSAIEEEYSNKNIRIIIDEATRNLSGSPNIPIAILDKIKNADIFICDITTINQDSLEGQRKVPNPNVLIELGYAIAYLGWGRIIMLFNTSFGKFPNDVPFDIDKHRISLFSFNLLNEQKENASKKQLEQLKNNLSTLLYEAINLVIKQNPEKPFNPTFSSTDIKKKRDINFLRELLSQIYIPILEEHIREAPRMINSAVFHFWESFRGVCTSSFFHIYDNKLKELIDSVFEYWNMSLSYGHQYTAPPGRDTLYFVKPGDMPFDETEQKDWDAASDAVKNLSISLDNFLTYVKENYLEIDLKELSDIAWNNYIEFMKEIRSRYESG